MHGKDKFPERLRAAFGDARNADIARKLGVSKATVTLYMGGRLPPTDVLLKIAEETGCNLHWLMTGEGPKWAHPAGAQPEGEARVIALYNGGAGGTGKSTAATFMALSLARRGYRTLLVEPYRESMCTDRIFAHIMIKAAFVKSGMDFDRYLTRDMFNTPAAGLDMHVGPPRARHMLVKHGVENFCAVPSDLRSKYSFIIVDAGRDSLLSNLDLLRAWLFVPSQVLIPCDPYRCRPSIEGTLQNLKDVSGRYDEIRVLGAFMNITLAGTPKRRVESGISDMNRLLPGKAFKTVIHADQKINEAVAEGVGAHALGTKVRAVREFDSLTDELLLRLDA
jgi:cellulose biosynthesis protein BcsQ